MFSFKNGSEKNGVSLSRLSMRRRSIILFSVLTCAFVALFCALTLRLVVKNVRLFYREASAHAVQYNADYLRRRLSGYLADLEKISASGLLDESDGQKINERLGLLNENETPYILGTFFADKNGLVRLSGGRTVDISGSPFFLSLGAGKETEGIFEECEPPLFEREHFVAARALQKDGAFGGVLFFAVDFFAVKNPARLLAFAKNASGFLMRRDGAFVVEPASDSVLKIRGQADFLPQKDREALYLFREAVKKNQSGSIVLDTAERGKEFFSFSRVAGTPWITGLAESESEFYKAFVRSLYRIAALFALFALVLILSFAFVTLSGTRGKSSHRLTLQQDSDFDELTGLWTESRFEEECERLLKENPDKNYMLFGIDIRGFRIVQQTEGVAVANEQLMALGRRLGQIAMQQGGIAARGAIDHLYLMYPIKDKESAIKEYESFLYNGNYFSGRAGERIPTKTGIVFAGKDYEKDSVQNLIGKTSYAKHIIQDSLLQNYSVYDKSMEERIIKDKKIERYIPVAFSHKEFYVVYQPKVDLSNGKVIGAEALVRWHSPELGDCMPDEFITLFERNGYINRLDFYVYKEVFEFLSKRAKAGKPNVPISVNMSRFHLSDEKFVQKFSDLFDNYDIPPELIEVEIVERSVGSGDSRLVEVTKQLHEKNFRVAIDDFGTGESSLNIISEIPADVLKLDQKFMRGDKSGKLPGKDEFKIVAKIVEMAKALGKETICEGVETEQQISFLRSVDVNYVQGFYYSRPLKEDDFVMYLERHA